MITLEPHNIKVQDMMTTDVFSLKKNHTMKQAKEWMKAYSISGMPVIDEDKYLLGIVSIADVLRALELDSMNKSIEDFMSKDVAFVYAQDKAGKALDIFRKYKFGRLPVLDEDNKLVGIMTTSDIANRLANILQISEITVSTEGVQRENVENSHNEDNILTYEIESSNFDKAGLASSSLKKYLQTQNVNSAIIRRAAIAAYEAEMNIVIHANNGKISAEITQDRIKIVAQDYGPGIENINDAMIPGFSTASYEIRQMGFGAGMGLPNIKSSADKFIIESDIGKGTKLEIYIYKG